MSLNINCFLKTAHSWVLLFYQMCLPFDLSVTPFTLNGIIVMGGFVFSLDVMNLFVFIFHIFKYPCSCQYGWISFQYATSLFQLFSFAACCVNYLLGYHDNSSFYFSAIFCYCLIVVLML